MATNAMLNDNFESNVRRVRIIRDIIVNWNDIIENEQIRESIDPENNPFIRNIMSQYENMEMSNQYSKESALIYVQASVLYMYLNMCLMFIQTYQSNEPCDE
jgi:hypothetical protein